MKPVTILMFAIAVIVSRDAFAASDAAPRRPTPTPIEATKPVDLPTPEATPTPPPPVGENGRAAQGSEIEGTYRTEGSPLIRVKRLVGNVYHLRSSDGWEGVGFLDQSIYRGVFQSRDASSAAVLGDLRIDWNRIEEPRVHQSRSDGTEPKDAVWQRVDRSAEIGRRADSKNGTKPPMLTVTPPPAENAAAYIYVEELPEAITKVAAAYPEGARHAGVEGTVMVQVLVGVEGTVTDTKVIKSIPELDAAAITAVRQWRFKPALSKGAPVAVWVAVPIKFSLH